jgi:hypothetical protein
MIGFILILASQVPKLNLIKKSLQKTRIRIKLLLNLSIIKKIRDMKPFKRITKAKSMLELRMIRTQQILAAHAMLNAELFS